MSALSTPSAWRRGFIAGEVLRRKYLVERVLGESDVALHIAATRKDLGQRVLLKVLLPELVARETVASRYLREARRAASLRSEHAARIVDVGRLATSEPFVACEWLEGSPLSAALNEGALLSIPRATEFVVQACDAIAEVHARGWVHGNLKPRNLFLARRSRGAPSVRVLDFGVAAVRAQVGRLDGGLTPARVVGGEPLYLAPEQLDPTHRADTRVDVWALGAILFELLAGRPPFAADGIAEILRLVAGAQAAPPGSLRAGVPQALDDIVLCCLQRDPRKRYTDAGELLAALDEAIADQSQTSVVRLDAVIEEREPTIEVRPFVPAIAPPAPPSRPGMRLPTVSAPMIADDAEDAIPSLVTSSDPSARELVVRPHPLAGQRVGPPPAPPSVSLGVLAAAMLMTGVVVTLVLLYLSRP